MRPLKRRQLARLQNGLRTRETDYELPILRALVAAGGRAPAGRVLGESERSIAPRLRQEAHDKVSTGESRWRNTARWVRQQLVNSGDLLRNSPHGVWEISERCRERLAQHS